MTGHGPLIPGHRSRATRWSLGLGFLLLATATGCRLVQTAANVPGQAVQVATPGQKNRNPIDPVEVQQRLLRFAGEYSMRMISGAEKLQRGTNALTRAETLEIKIALGTETCSIASGPNGIAALLDMTVFVTVSRMALEDYWQPRVFGESARPMIEYCRSAEAAIWRLAGVVLKPEQQTELRAAIAAWHRDNPLPESVVVSRALDLASRVAASTKDEAAKPGSVFSLLQMDPLSDLDPAVRELAQTRLFAERALYVTQRLPMLLRWQTELLSLNALAQPTVQQVVSNSTQIAAAVDRFARVAEQLPGEVATERREILKALESQEGNLSPLVNEVRQTLDAGSHMSASLNTTLTTFDALMKRFGVGETNSAGPPGTNAEPFRIQDYGRTAEKLETAARQLTELLTTLDRTLGSTNLSQLAAQATPAIQLAQAGGKGIVDYAFWKGVLLVVTVLMVALIYRFLSARLAAANSKSSTPTTTVS